MRELTIEKKGTEHFESRGWLARKVAYLGRNGAPDHWYLKAGVWVLVEYKQADKNPSAAQLREHDRLRGLGQRVFVIDSIEGAYALVDRMEAELAGA